MSQEHSAGHCAGGAEDVALTCSIKRRLFLSCVSVSWVFLPSEDPEIGNVAGLTANEVCTLSSGW